MPLAALATAARPRPPTLARAAHARWAKVADLLATHEDSDVHLAANQLRIWLDVAGGVTFEGAQGLPASWRSALRRELRDERVLQIAEQHYPSKAGRGLADAMGTDLSRYERSGWIIDRAAGRRPDGKAGDFFDLLTLGAVKSDRLRQLFNVLSG
jgi:hypothetical protein